MNESAVLLTAHGTVEDLSDMPAFLARIRHGRPASPALVDDMQRRYRAIGGSPLLAITRTQAERLSEVLGLPVFIGMRLWRPEVADALREAQAAGVTRLCVLPLAAYSVQVYARAAERALAELGGPALELRTVAPFGSDPALVAAHAQTIAPFLEGTSTDDTEVLLTAHSLPSSVIAAGDPYGQEVEKSAHAISAALGRPARLAYQSQGADGGDWLGPDLRSVLEAVRSEGKRRVVIAPVGFLCDHVETLYDLDVEARAMADALGIELRRVPALNDAPALIEALATVARRALSD